MQPAIRTDHRSSITVGVLQCVTCIVKTNSQFVIFTIITGPTVLVQDLLTSHGEPLCGTPTGLLVLHFICCVLCIECAITLNTSLAKPPQVSCCN